MRRAFRMFAVPAAFCLAADSNTYSRPGFPANAIVVGWPVPVV